MLALLAVLVPAVGHTANAPPPLQVDLDAFDAMKKTAALPDGVTLAYIDTGNPTGPAVVLIHGYTDNARDWVPMLPYLSKRFRLILVDIRGHGKSSKPECCYTRLDFAYDIKLLLDALSIRQADVVGHSPGQHHRPDLRGVLARAHPSRRAHFLDRRPSTRLNRAAAVRLSPPRSASSRIPSIRTRRS